MFLNTVLTFIYGCGLIFTILVMASRIRDLRSMGESINWPKNLLIGLLVLVMSPLWMAWGLYQLAKVIIYSIRNKNQK